MWKKNINSYNLHVKSILLKGKYSLKINILFMCSLLVIGELDDSPHNIYPTKSNFDIIFISIEII